MGVGAGLYMCDVVKKSSRSLSHLLMSSCISYPFLSLFATSCHSDTSFYMNILASFFLARYSIMLRSIQQHSTALSVYRSVVVVFTKAVVFSVSFRLFSSTAYYYGRPMEYGRPLYFCPVVSSSFFFFPRLISAVADWMSAILPHVVWP